MRPVQGRPIDIIEAAATAALDSVQAHTDLPIDETAVLIVTPGIGAVLSKEGCARVAGCLWTLREPSSFERDRGIESVTAKAVLMSSQSIAAQAVKP